MDKPEEFVENFIAHFGVPGMKWGHRKAAQEANASQDHKALKAVQTKAKAGGGTKALSNAELQAAISRMNLENQFSDLKAKRSKVSKGLSIVRTVLGVAKTGQDAYNTGATIGGTIAKAVPRRS